MSDHTPTSSALATLASDERYMAQVPMLARQFSRSEMCPEVWRAKPIPAQASEDARTMVLAENERKVADLAIIGQSLAELNIRLSLNVLGQVYVVKGRPGYMAQLQILLADRFGVPVVPLDEESDDKSASVKIKGKDGEWHKVTVTMAEAVKAKWPERNPNYATMPDRMLMARAVTKAIDRHAPQVKMMLPPADAEELFLPDDAEVPEDGVVDGDVEDSAVLETGEMIHIAQAKKIVLDHIRAGSNLAPEQAAQMTKLLWDSHGLPNGQDMMPRSRVDQLLASITTERADDEPIDVEVIEVDSTPPKTTSTAQAETVESPAGEQEPIWGEGEEPF